MTNNLGEKLRKVTDAAGAAFEFVKDEALNNFGNVLKRTASGIDEWGKVDLTRDVVGILPVANLPSTLSFQTPIVGGLDNLKTLASGTSTVAFRSGSPWGLEFLTGGTGTDYAYGRMTLGAGMFDNNCSLSVTISNLQTSASGASNMFFGLGENVMTGGDHVMTATHIGFYIKTVSGAVNLYATCADGTTETRSSVLTTVHNSFLKLFWVLDAAAESVDFYYSKANGPMTYGATITTNVPVGDTGSSEFQVSVGANGLADAVGFAFVGALHTQY